MDYRRQLITLADVYATAKSISAARVATIVVNHGGFFRRIASGGSCSVDMYLQVKRWFSENWPEGVPWPEGVDRPDILPDARHPLPPAHAPPLAAE